MTWANVTVKEEEGKFFLFSPFWGSIPMVDRKTAYRMKEYLEAAERSGRHEVQNDIKKALDL